jgi:hypothetical protein
MALRLPFRNFRDLRKTGWKATNLAAARLHNRHIHTVTSRSRYSTTAQGAKASPATVEKTLVDACRFCQAKFNGLHSKPKRSVA